MKSFQSFRLDTANQCLWRGQERVPIAPKAFDVLRYLVENPGRLVTQDEVLDKLWPENPCQSGGVQEIHSGYPKDSRRPSR